MKQITLAIALVAASFFIEYRAAQIFIAGVLILVNLVNAVRLNR